MRIERKNKSETEQRNFLDVAFEVKQMDETEDGFFRFEGFAATYGNIDNHNDIIQAGAFSESLTERMPVILWQHKQSEPIGVVESIRDTAEGLYIVARLPKEDTLVSGRVIPQIKVGSIRKMSIGWITQGYKIDPETDVRTITKGLLLEISTVTMPANDEAAITGFKNRDGGEEVSKIEVGDLEILDGITELTAKNLEKALCESKRFSNNAAKKLACLLTRETREDEEVQVLAELKNLHKANDEREVLVALQNITFEKTED